MIKITYVNRNGSKKTYESDSDISSALRGAQRLVSFTPTLKYIIVSCHQAVNEKETNSSGK